MALIVDGISPTVIEIDGNSDINVLEVDGVAYWGKPFTLTINTDAYTTVEVKRHSSKYQNASIGTLETGNLIYYGDWLTISVVSVEEGYSLSSFTINGIEKTDTFGISVKEPIIVEARSTSNTLTWTTVWSGSQDYISNTRSERIHEVTISNVDFSTCSSIRITGKSYYNKESFSVAIAYGESFTIIDYTNKKQTIEVSSPNIIKITTVPWTSGLVFRQLGIVLEKVEVLK